MGSSPSKLPALTLESQGFLHGVQLFDTRHTDVVGVSGGFDLKGFSQSLFDRLNIPCPVQLHKAVDKRRAEFLAGRAVAKAALNTAGVAETDIPIGQGRAPLWPLGVSGSISHTNTKCIALVTRATGMQIGVDIEEIAEGSSLEAIFKVALDATEAGLIHKQNEIAPNLLSTLIFSAKETLFKALYPTVGEYFGFDCAQFCTVSEDDILTLRLTKTLHPTLGRGQTFDLHFRTFETYLITWLVQPAQPV